METEIIPMERLARVYVKIREARAELSRQFEERDDALKAQQAEIANVMKDRLRAEGATSTRTPHGTVTLRTSVRYYAQDWEALHNFIKENDALQLLEKRIAQRNMASFLEENPAMAPPGLSSVSEVEVSVTKR